MKIKQLFNLAFGLGFLLVTSLSSFGITQEEQDYFETHVRPNLVKYCFECHSTEEGKVRGGLNMDTRETMREGGSSGELFDEERWDYSLFVDAITWADADYEMPPKNKMPDDVIDVLVEW
ncbi:MAG: c-type cytochrome domain-containing protein, partial [Verrucomicrobiota bacterium]